MTCPSCGYKAELEHGLSVFNCPNTGCGKKTCRHCQEEAHPGLRCEEVRHFPTFARHQVMLDCICEPSKFLPSSDIAIVIKRMACGSW